MFFRNCLFYELGFFTTLSSSVVYRCLLDGRKLRVSYPSCLVLLRQNNKRLEKRNLSDWNVIAMTKQWTLFLSFPWISFFDDVMTKSLWSLVLISLWILCRHLHRVIEHALNRPSSSCLQRLDRQDRQRLIIILSKYLSNCMSMNVTDFHSWIFFVDPTKFISFIILLHFAIVSFAVHFVSCITFPSTELVDWNIRFPLTLCSLFFSELPSSSKSTLAALSSVCNQV